MRGGDIMKINTLIDELKNKRKEIYNKYYDEELGFKNISIETYKELDSFILNVLHEYDNCFCTEEEDADFAYNLVLLEMDRAKLYSMVK